MATPGSWNQKFRVMWLGLFLIVGTAYSAELSAKYYEDTCPTVLSIIREAVHKAVAAELRMGASLLRLHFHDCFVNGCDASFLLKDTSSFTGEQSVIINGEGGIRGSTVIDDIKSQVESICPGVVSCADILAVAARDSVVALGGPTWEVGLGRRDSTTASLSAANSDIPNPLGDLPSLLSSFSKQGFTAKEMVALAGAHTIGQSQCVSFRNRVYNESNIAASFAASRRSICPSNGGDNNLSPLDATTPVVFDNEYFKNLLNAKGLLHSDQELFNGGSATNSHVMFYSKNLSAFFADFARAMVKMSNLSPLTGKQGEVRTKCWKIN